MSWITRMLLIGAASAPLALGCAAAVAETTAGPDAQPTGAPVVSDVVVTAQKRSQKLQDVPISMEVVSGPQLTAFHENNFHDIQNYVPNVYVQMSAADNVIYIRGFGSSPNNFGFDQDVSFYEDGVYLGRSKQFETPFFDLQRAEVLRGPQGALFGKNTAAGAVSVVTAGPTDHFEAAANVAYNFDLAGVDAYGYVSGPVSDTLSLRLAVKAVDEDGYIQNRATGSKDPHTREDDMRFTAKWVPNANFNYTTKLEYSDRRLTGWDTVSAPLTTTSTPVTYQYDGGAGPGGSAFDQTDSWLASGTGNLSLGDFTLTSVTGYAWFETNSLVGIDQDIPGGGVSPTLIGVSWPEKFNQYSQELRITSPAGRTFEYIAGVYYDQSQYWMGGGLNYNLLGGALVGDEHNDFNQLARTASVFGQGTWHVTQGLRLIGSLRYTDTDKRASFSELLISGAALNPITQAHGHINEGDVDPSFTLQYDFTPRIMGYLTYGQGSKSGGFLSNTAGVTDSTFSFRPEHSENYEAGVKSTLFDGQLVADVSIYNTDFKDLQVSALNPETLNFVTGNAASATSRGVEWTLTWKPVGDFDVTLSGAYQDAHYDDYKGASCLATETLAQCNPNDPASIAANNIKGVPLEFASKWTGGIQAHYTHPLPYDLVFDGTVGAAGRSGYYASDDYDPTYGYQPSYVKVDARLQVGPEDKRWHIAVIGKNLNDAKTFSYAIPWPVPVTENARAIRYLEETRNIAIEIGAKF